MYLHLSFFNVSDLMNIKNELRIVGGFLYPFCYSIWTSSSPWLSFSFKCYNIQLLNLSTYYYTGLLMIFMIMSLFLLINYLPQICRSHMNGVLDQGTLTSLLPTH